MHRVFFFCLLWKTLSISGVINGWTMPVLSNKIFIEEVAMGILACRTKQHIILRQLLDHMSFLIYIISFFLKCARLLFVDPSKCHR